MNPKALQFILIFTCGVLVLSGCLPDAQASHLGAGAVLYTVPDLVRSEQESVLEYLTSSSRLASLPPSAAWSLDKTTVTGSEYRFCSGNWLMIIYQAAEDGEQQVIIIDMVHDSSWCGYIKPDGQIIDSCYRR